MSKNILRKVSIGMAWGAALFPLAALAVTGAPIITSPTQISTLLTNVLTIVSGVVFIIALIMLLWAAILYLTAGGSEDRVSRAKNYLIYAIVGIAVAILAFSVEPFLRNFFMGQ